MYEDRIRNYFIMFLAGVIIGSGLFWVVLRPGRIGQLDRAAEANARATDDLVARLGITIEQLPRYIDSLESDNKRLTEYIIDAGKITERLTGTVTASGANTASAAEVSARLRAGIEAMESWYSDLRGNEPWLFDMGPE